MSIPDFFLPQFGLVVVTDMRISAMSDTEREIAESAACCASANGGFRKARRMIKRLSATEVVVIGPANSRCIQYLLDKADFAGIGIRRIPMSDILQAV